MTDKLNIVYIHTHDTGRMIGPYNSVFETPALNKLASMGTVLDHLYCVGPTCSPSRSGLLTGRMPHRNGMLGLAHRGFSIYDMDQHLCRFLGRNGYETVLCGMQHESNDPLLIGYDRVSISSRPEAEDLTAWDNENADAACAFIQESHERPFFLSYGLVQTHRPFLELDNDIDVISVQGPDCLPQVKNISEDMARFMTSVRRADACIGRVFDALEQEGLLSNTIIFYTTDHGAAFPFMKCTLTEGGTGVAGIIYLPGGPRSGKRIESLLSHLDFYPTLCDLLELDKPNWLEGRSFADILLDGTANDKINAVNKAIFSEVNYHAAYEPQRCIRDSRFRLIIRYPDLREDSPDRLFPGYKPRLSNIDEGLSKDYLRNASYITEDGDIDQRKLIENLHIKLAEADMPDCESYRFRYADRLLFDLEQDPAELCNLAEHPEYMGVLHHLEEQLLSWQLWTDDPLAISGKVEAPPVAEVNRQTCLDPDSSEELDYEQIKS